MRAGTRILIVNVNWLGDALFSTPAIRALRRSFTNGYLACLVPTRCEEVLRGNPYLDEIITYRDRRPFLSPLKTLGLIYALRKRRFDQAIFLHGSTTKVFMTWLAGIPNRIGFTAPGRDFFLTRRLAATRGDQHKTDMFLDLLSRAGVRPDGREPDFFCSEADSEKALELLAKEGIGPGAPYIVVHPGGNWTLKRWPLKYFIEWIKLALREFEGKILVCGTERESSLADAIRGSFPGEERIGSICGKTTVGMLAAILKNARFLLSNDSGPIHLAASQATPLIGVFGPTSPELTGPLSKGPAIILHRDVGCGIPCYFRSCDTRVCMEWLKPQDVFRETKKLLQLRSGERA
jgi:lipopolysaccharide heptosyltransferase II